MDDLTEIWDPWELDDTKILGFDEFRPIITPNILMQKLNKDNKIVKQPSLHNLIIILFI